MYTHYNRVRNCPQICEDIELSCEDVVTGRGCEVSGVQSSNLCVGVGLCYMPLYVTCFFVACNTWHLALGT